MLEMLKGCEGHSGWQHIPRTPPFSSFLCSGPTSTPTCSPFPKLS